MSISELAAIGTIAGVITTLLGGLVAMAVAWGEQRTKLRELEKRADSSDKHDEKQDSYIAELREKSGEHRGRLESIHEETE